MAPLLETRGLSRRYGDIQAVEDLSLQVQEGDIYGFLGLNGAGKTTTIRMILRLLRPSSGKVHIFGKNIEKDFISIMRQVGALIELPAYYPYLSGFDNLNVFRWATGGVPRSRILECLERVGLAERARHRVGTYSQGMRQRLAIAMAILARPKLVILDEPTNGLDPQGVNQIRKMIQEMNREEKVTFVISSHILHEVEITCNRVAIIRKGRLVVQDDLSNLLAPTEETTLRIECEPKEMALKLLRSREGVTREQPDGSLEYRGKPATFADINADLVRQGVRVSSFTPHPFTLEDYFLSR